MAYKNWVIGGLTPSWVEPDFKDDKENRTLTLKCAAIRDELNADPITELDSFQGIASEKIGNEDLLNGGSKLQVGPGGQIITVTATSDDGSDVRIWSRCALKQVNVNLDSYYSENSGRSVIEYELVIVYETSGPGASYVFTPDFREYNEIEYYCWTDKGSDFPNHFAQGNEIGYMKITVPKNIVAVEVYGSACAAFESYPNWIDCNGEKQYWHYSHDEGDFGPEVNILPYGWEKLRWEIDSTNEVILQTSTHDSASPGDLDEYTGCWLQYVRLIPG